MTTNAIGTQAIGLSFVTELRAAGLAGLPFSSGSDGALHFPDPSVTADQQAAILAVYAAHDPTLPNPQAAYVAARRGGVAVTSAGTPALDATYGCSDVDQANMTTVQGLIGIGAFPGWFKDIKGTRVVMTSTQFSAIAVAIAVYVLELEADLDGALAPGGKWVARPAAAAIA